MNYKELSQEAWEEWGEHPVTLAVRHAVQCLLDQQREAAQAAYWAGRAWPESDRQSLVRMAQWHEDFFDTTADEVMAMIEATDEHKRNKTE